MNARQRKKQYKMEIKRLNLLPNEVLIFRFDSENWNPEDIGAFSEYVHREISSKVMFVPKDMEMTVISQ